jgi:lipopolysaccharide/colanic/teichoic acid biosynthesis glycosyltransferase
MDIEKEIKEIKEIMYGNTEKILKTMDRLHSHEEKINENSNKIQEKVGALEVLHTINNVKKRFFIMWLSTFLLLVCSICLNIFLFVR